MTTVHPSLASSGPVDVFAWSDGHTPPCGGGGRSTSSAALVDSEGGFHPVLMRNFDDVVRLTELALRNYRAKVVDGAGVGRAGGPPRDLVGGEQDRGDEHIIINTNTATSNSTNTSFVHSSTREYRIGLEHRGWKLIPVGPDSYGLVAYNPNKNLVVVTFAGSCCQQDWETNLHCRPTPWARLADAEDGTDMAEQHDGRANHVHIGYLSRYENFLREDILRLLSPQGIGKQVNEKTRILCCGHSCGGGMAQLAIWDIVTVVGSAWFGSNWDNVSQPRVFGYFIAAAPSITTNAGGGGALAKISAAVGPANMISQFAERDLLAGSGWDATIAALIRMLQRTAERDPAAADLIEQLRGIDWLSELGSYRPLGKILIQTVSGVLACAGPAASTSDLLGFYLDMSDVGERSTRGSAEDDEELFVWGTFRAALSAIGLSAHLGGDGGGTEFLRWIVETPSTALLYRGERFAERRGFVTTVSGTPPIRTGTGISSNDTSSAVMDEAAGGLIPSSSYVHAAEAEDIHTRTTNYDHPATLSARRGFGRAAHDEGASTSSTAQTGGPEAIAAPATTVSKTSVFSSEQLAVPQQQRTASLLTGIVPVSAGKHQMMGASLSSPGLIFPPAAIVASQNLFGPSVAMPIMPTINVPGGGASSSAAAAPLLGRPISVSGTPQNQPHQTTFAASSRAEDDQEDPAGAGGFEQKSADGREQSQPVEDQASPPGRQQQAQELSTSQRPPLLENYPQQKLVHDDQALLSSRSAVTYHYGGEVINSRPRRSLGPRSTFHGTRAGSGGLLPPQILPTKVVPAHKLPAPAISTAIGLSPYEASVQTPMTSSSTGVPHMHPGLTRPQLEQPQVKKPKLRKFVFVDESVGAGGGLSGAGTDTTITPALGGSSSSSNHGAQATGTTTSMMNSRTASSNTPGGAEHMTTTSHQLQQLGGNSMLPAQSWPFSAATPSCGIYAGAAGAPFKSEAASGLQVPSRVGADFPKLQAMLPSFRDKLEAGQQYFRRF
ncbi:unnamed protein product [Amoebophrya sp. A25]|nr:unnamed protein product [Amoebophrya sp. A25]|eukprot:GSA25T00004545001.1